MVQTLRTTPRYTDFYTNFNVKGGVTGRQTGDLYRLTDADAVKTSIRNLVLTDPGERFFEPYVGGGIRRSLFDNFGPNTEHEIRTQVETTIRNYERRARLHNVYINAVPDSNAYAITIVFSVINNPEILTLNVILNRVR